MIQQAINKLTAIEAEAAANLFLSDHMPDRYCAGNARYNNLAQVWRVPIVMSYLHIGEIGEVGEITVSEFSGKIISHTPFDEMRIKGRSLYEQNREAIEAAFLQARND